MSLLIHIKEQSTFEFTGRVNVMTSRGQHLAVIMFYEGYVVSCRYQGTEGRKSLFNLIIADIERSEKLKFIDEPEIVETHDIDFKLSYSEIEQDSQKHYESYKQALKLKPPESLKLVINDKFVLEGEDVSPEEFDILKLISDEAQVGEVYKRSSLFDFETTQALVSLRKKKALRVIE